MGAPGYGVPTNCTDKQIAVWNSTKKVWECGTSGGSTTGTANAIAKYDSTGKLSSSSIVSETKGFVYERITNPSDFPRTARINCECDRDINKIECPDVFATSLENQPTFCVDKYDDTYVRFFERKPSNHLVIKDRTQGDKKILSSDAGGKATWKTFSELGVSLEEKDNLDSVVGRGNSTERLVFFKGLVGIKNLISNSFQFVDGKQATGKVLTSDAGGNATWENISRIPSCLPNQYLLNDGRSWICKEKTFPNVSENAQSFKIAAFGLPSISYYSYQVEDQVFEKRATDWTLINSPLSISDDGTKICLNGSCISNWTDISGG